MKKTFFIIMGMAMLAACTGVKVSTAYDPQVNFDQYKTFCWLQGCDIQYQGPHFGYDSQTFVLLQEAIKSELESKGMVNDQNDPDLLVGYHVIMEEHETVIRDSENLHPYDREIVFWNGYDAYLKQEVYLFLKGTLVIDIIDAKKGTAIWQSNSVSYLELLPELDEKDIKRGVAKALKDYPPRAK